MPMTKTQFAAVAGAPDLPATVAENGVDQYFLDLVRHASLVETSVNAGLDSASRTNYYSNSIDENGIFRGAVRLPVSVAGITTNT